MHSRDMEMRSPALSSMSTSRGGWVRLTSSARRTRSSVVLPMALTTATTSSPSRRGPRHVVGDGADPVGVADRGAPELLYHQWHPVEATDWEQGPSSLAPDSGGRVGADGGPWRIG